MSIDMTDMLLTRLEQQQTTTDITPDDYWDNAGVSNVRSSSDSDPTKYYDPREAFKEGGDKRAVATLLPERGPRGVIVPRATRGGRSSGYDPYKPTIVNIDPDIKGQCSVVDLSKLNNDMIAEAYNSTLDIANPKLAAAMTFRKLAIGTEPVGMPAYEQQEVLEPLSPVPGAYVASHARINKTLKKNVQVAPQVKQVRPIQSLNEKASMFTHPASTQLPVKVASTHVAPTFQQDSQEPSRASLFDKHNRQQDHKVPSDGYSIVPPAEQVVYEVDGFGHLTAPYHKVIREGINLVLVYDNRYTGGQKFFPEPNDNKTLIVDVKSHPCVYKVMAPGIQFMLDVYDVCVLFIVEEAVKGE